MNLSDVLLRWSIGSQDTVSLMDYSSLSKYKDMIWLTKLSIASFQKWFQDSTFLLLYNGVDYDGFLNLFHECPLHLFSDVQIINQLSPETKQDKFINPYKFVPFGVWMKWVPFRFDVTKHEICIDTDIICVNKPLTWYKWLQNDMPIVTTPERYEKVVVNTCGDFCNHILIKDKKPFNCGIVGQKKNYDFSQRFYEICESVDYGHSHDSMFITEQGAINLWIRSLEQENVLFFELDAEHNTWIRDFIFFIRRGFQIETIHAVSWHKKIVKFFKKEFEKKVYGEYNDSEFVSDIIKNSSGLDAFAKHMIVRQLSSNDMESEVMIPNNFL